jgi:hypothetical protein
MGKPMKVHLDYFKLTGKWYSSAEFESIYSYSWEVADQVRTMQSRGDLPGLAKGARSFHILLRGNDDIADYIHLLPYRDPPRWEK